MATKTDAELVMEAGIESEMLDDVVHSIASNEASNVNNNGLKEQVRYLTEKGLTVQAIIEEAAK